ncbi:hypothetical protein [Desulfovibrio ferrophilus]|uniref:Uncharacterized protein n=1 Tax=Desulfovibrio ferrophilus TaxID=241368 RepID=A0A2Z6AYT1_9BACT|nr:hypothetical protein [Desulfovibrio ferrophilus]BBD08424.1 uncharacterized protein DFE_1698 [Desulfovibrio ferrophilus]
MNSAVVSPGIRRALGRARRAMDPDLAAREGRAVVLCSAMTAFSLFNSIKKFSGEQGEASRLRRRAELLVSELKALESLCGDGWRDEYEHL